MRTMKKRLLDITPEGRLLRETKDVIDELLMLVNIKAQEETVVKTFVEHVDANIESRDSVSSKWTLKCAKNLLRGIQGQISELKALKDAAEETSRAVNI